VNVGLKPTRTKAHRTKAHRTKAHRTKAHAHGQNPTGVGQKPTLAPNYGRQQFYASCAYYLGLIDKSKFS